MSQNLAQKKTQEQAPRGASSQGARRLGSGGMPLCTPLRGIRVGAIMPRIKDAPTSSGSTLLVAHLANFNVLIYEALF